MSRRLTTLAAVLALAMVSACATMPEDPEERAEAEAINDPLEPTNRVLYDVNMYLDDNIAAPVAEGYRDNFPDWFRNAVHNILANLQEPYTAGNDLLQGNTHAAADALGRFAINSTFGLFGSRDAVADSGGAKGHKTDLATTFAVWGVEEGPYLMLPFFGPSSLRDTSGKVAEFWAEPMGAVFSSQGLNVINNIQMGADTLDTRTQYLDPLKEIRRTSIDEYAAIRSLYRQTRDSAIANARNGQTQTRDTMPSAAAAATSAGAPASSAPAGAPAAAPAPAPAVAPTVTGVTSGTEGAKPSAVEFIETKH